MDISTAKEVVSLYNQIIYYEKEIESWEEKLNKNKSTCLNKETIESIINDSRKSLDNAKEKLQSI